MNIPSMTDVWNMKVFSPALSNINSFSDNTSSPRIFIISKWPVISRWQSLNAWYSLITVSFTVTESHSVPELFNPAFIHFFHFYEQRCLQFTCESGNVCKSLKLSSTSGDLLTDKSSQMIGRWTEEFSQSMNIMAWILILSPRKTRVSKEHDIMK